MALQNAWNVCVLRYLGTNDNEARYYIINDFRDAIVDIKPDGAKALRKTFEEWEQEEWIPLCQKQLNLWIHDNHFEAQINKNQIDEYQNIKHDYNHLRFRKIMQVIQDSGIGLGAGKERGHYELSGFMGETSE